MDNRWRNQSILSHPHIRPQNFLHCLESKIKLEFFWLEICQDFYSITNPLLSSLRSY
jgi:hypothetical protein